MNEEKKVVKYGRRVQVDKRFNVSHAVEKLVGKLSYGEAFWHDGSPFLKMESEAAKRINRCAAVNLDTFEARAFEFHTKVFILDGYLQLKTYTDEYFKGLRQNQPDPPPIPL